MNPSRSEKAQKDLDNAVALLLVGPSSDTALGLVRACRRSRAEAEGAGNGKHEVYDELYRDSRALHHAVILLESDPEIINRNSLARILTGIEPVVKNLNNLKNALSPENRNAAGILSTIISVSLEIGAATQYIESAKLNANVHFEEGMIDIEERLVLLMSDMVRDPDERVERASVFCDDIRMAVDTPEGRAAVLFILWTLILIVSYGKAKASMGKTGWIQAPGTPP